MAELGEGEGGNTPELAPPIDFEQYRKDRVLMGKLSKVAKKMQERRAKEIKGLPKRFATFKRAAAFFKGETDYLEGLDTDEKANLAADLREIVELLG